jgi:hypothetical protein
MGVNSGEEGKGMKNGGVYIAKNGGTEQGGRIQNI